MGTFACIEQDFGFIRSDGWNGLTRENRDFMEQDFGLIEGWDI